MGGSWEMLLGVPFAPTRILFWVLFLRKRLTRPQGNCEGTRQLLLFGVERMFHAAQYKQSSVNEPQMDCPLATRRHLIK